MDLQEFVAPNWRNTVTNQIPYLREEPRAELKGGEEVRDLPTMFEFYYFYSNSTNIYLAHITCKALC